jgi:hypothetical protein
VLAIRGSKFSERLFAFGLYPAAISPDNGRELISMSMLRRSWIRDAAEHANGRASGSWCGALRLANQKTWTPPSGALNSGYDEFCSASTAPTTAA